MVISGSGAAGAGGIDVQSVVTAMAGNSYVVGLANLGGIIAFLVLLYTFGRSAIRFVKTAYRQNVRAAIYRVRRQDVRRANRAAGDLHTFVGYLVRNAMLVLMGWTMLIISILAGISALISHQSARQASWFWSGDIGPVSGLVITGVMYVPSFVLFFYSAVRTQHLVSTTMRVRWKMIERRRRARGTTEH